MQVVAGLIGDIVGSREAQDRPRLQQHLLEVLDEVAERWGHGLAVTLGDEFQGRFPTLQTALAVAWGLHLGTIGTARLRIGIGWGEILVESADDSPFGQDGPAWWRARDAIERVDASYPARTLVSTETEWDELVNAYLTLRDAHLDDLDEADATILAAMGRGDTQRAAATELGLHESSVSRRITRHHLAVLHRVATPRLPGFDA